MTQLALFEVPTDKQRKAIAILQAYPGIEPLVFAKLMWPKSKGWGPKAKFYWSMERVALGMLGQLQAAGFAFSLMPLGTNGTQWHAAVNIARVTLEPSPVEEPTPF